MRSPKIDELDLKIISHLQENGRIPVAELAKRLNQPENTVRYRIERLLKNGVIRRFTALVDPRALGLNVSAAVMFKVDPKKLDQLLEKLTSMKDVTNIYQLSGEWDLIAVVFAKDIQDLHERVEELRRAEGVKEMNVMITTRVIKSEYRYVLT
ncbi:MAG: Lrp/AsnC family transcriptional regulator [Candidatus Calditenuis sp.]|jgi:Lrp/AsnC family transcriptional regulator for asnA, asnC and gidA|nr:Lrp/AsnC family transcriptional regulator [Candidatus Calditenuis sp.]MDT7968130.1 Lrp/AsnC family transcriptional regulator [Candidatus Calditenuis sp.]